jgi:hypothetical protein
MVYNTQLRREYMTICKYAYEHAYIYICGYLSIGELEWGGIECY